MDRPQLNQPDAMDREAWIAHVRDALTHLYDPVHLQSHPLAQYADGGEGLDHLTRAQRLRRTLLEALEQLSPPDLAAAPPDAGICYSALHYRYVDGLGPEQIAELLGLSARQVYRKLREGIEAIATLLWDRWQVNRPEEHASTPAPSLAERPVNTPTQDPVQDRQSLVQATVQQLAREARPELLELTTILEGIVRELQTYCRQLQVRLELGPAPAPCYIHADRSMLRQGLINILTRSLEQQDAGTAVHLKVEARPAENRLCVHIVGSGPRARTETRPSRREGLGYQVATQLLELQGMQVHQQKGAGCHVQIQIPTAGAQSILVIDDMPDIPQLFQRFTAAHGVEIFSAHNATQAFAFLQEVTPALILLDVMLPRTDGWEILQTLKSSPATASIPVVVCSILNEPDLATALGADDYLRKPVSQEALLQLLRRWLHPAPAATPWRPPGGW